MHDKWKLTVKTSLPGACSGRRKLKTKVFTFDSFDSARTALRSQLREFAFSENEMFDGNGHIIGLTRCLNNIILYDDPDLCVKSWLDAKLATQILNIYACILEGRDVDVDFECGVYHDSLIAVDLRADSIAIRGTSEGIDNDYDPKVNTNLFSIEEEKDYYLYIDDLFGQYPHISAKLYMDLKKKDKGIMKWKKLLLNSWTALL